METLISSRESDILKSYLFLAFLTQVNVDNGVCMHMHVYMKTCYNTYQVFIKFKLRVLFSHTIRLLGSINVIFNEI